MLIMTKPCIPTAASFFLGSVTDSLAISLHCMWKVETRNVSYHRIVKSNVTHSSCAKIAREI